jgi:hypothetical protein
MGGDGLIPSGLLLNDYVLAAYRFAIGKRTSFDSIDIIRYSELGGDG